MTDTKRKLRSRKTTKPNPAQQTLKDMFGSKSSSFNAAQETPVLEPDNDVEETPDNAVEDAGREEIVETIGPTAVSQSFDPKPIKPTPALRHAGSQPTKVFSIFEKRKPTPPPAIEIPDSPPADIIDITAEEPGSSAAHDRHTPVPSGSSQNDPIIVESSPAKPSAVSTGPVWTIFQKKTLQQTTLLKGKQKAAEGLLAPLPDSLGQHVRGPQTKFKPSSSFSFATRTVDEPSPVPSTSHLGDILPQVVLDHQEDPPNSTVDSHAYERQDYVESIPSLHRQYPAVARSLRRDSSNAASSPHQDAWTDKWRPHRAEEVIGNEELALYLRDWLVALRLQMASGTGETLSHGVKSKKRRPPKSRKPEIIRHVKKKRKMDNGLAGFLASDEEDSPDELVFGDDDDEFIMSQDLRGYSSATTPDASSQYSSPLSEPDDEPADLCDVILPFPYTPPDFGSRIHNTILLTGPSGCGKTAAVYACAEELGWDVFEVYPGIGERGGPELNKLIGDIGKNHIVHSALQRSPISRSYFSRSGRKAVIRIDSDDDDDGTTPIELSSDVDSPVAELVIKQSLILIEEVDILYGSDTGFWPAVINIIKDSRRPIVMTCNDPTLVPWSELPLQTTLSFIPCPPPLAASYLQASCLSESFTPTRDTVLRLYTDGLTDSSEALPLHHSACRLDLRFAVNQLQYWSSQLTRPSVVSTATVTTSPEEDFGASRTITGVHNAAPVEALKSPIEHLPAHCWHDSVSFAESQLSRDPSFLLKLYDEPTGPSDSELGYTVLSNDLLPHPTLVSPYYTHDYSLSQEVVAAARRGSRAEPDASLRRQDILTGNLREARMAFGNQALQVLSHCLKPATMFSGDSALYTDYLPWIRYMVEVDNAIEEIVSPPGTQSQIRRQTRNSQRAAQERHIPLEATELEILSRNAFRL
ncbi:hypothetical protein EIP91_000663 [Steccherinum ochraceum]|uniref:AAA+ ATPase domain-containing protein n=1 Tax=Steccherinum ochraceum TaxID=92696 RepID=A0A4R0RJE3_9APHY|nr:hypothetical protein EIP91_000663 [Steccherinum ochraceum]